MRSLLSYAIVAIVSFCAYPFVTRYLIIPVGQTAWDDIKHIAYSIKDKIKSKV